MAIQGLGYLGIRTPLVEQWSEFASRLLAMQQVDRGGKTRSFRMDDHKQRLVIADEPGKTMAFAGWEVSEKADLARYAVRLEDAGFRVGAGSRDLCDQRLVEDLIFFDDPDGNRIELVWKPATVSDPFIPGRPIEGFATGPLGMGHVVFYSPNVQAMIHCYRDILGFAISDYMKEPIELYFLHVNPRHHSLALVGGARQGVHHFMVEYANLDDVGQGYDIALHEQERVAFTLGRHTNDFMTSFYAHSPSDFFVEAGWGGRLIDIPNWTPYEMHGGPSFWGHERLYMEEPARAALRAVRMGLADAGLRAPAHTNYDWLDSVAIP